MSIDLQSFAFETLLWTGALIALVLVLRRPVSRHFGARAAYALWSLPFLRLVLPPIVLPAWLAPEAPPAAASAIPVPMPVAEYALAETEGGAVLLQPMVQSSPTIDWALLALAAWLAGALVLLVRRYALYFAMRRELLAGSVQVGTRGRVRLIESPATPSPVAFGVFDKVVALPDGFMAHTDPTRRDLALEHELAHHRAHDLLANALVQPLFALHWFNPLGRVGWRALRRDQEAACDARVVARCQPQLREKYASTIASFATSTGMGGGARNALAAPMACPVLGDKSIIHRLRSLTMSDISPRRRLAARALIVGALAALPLTASISYAESLAAPEPPAPVAAPAAPDAPASPDAPLAPDAPPEPLTPLPPLALGDRQDITFLSEDENDKDAKRVIRVERKVVKDASGKPTEQKSYTVNGRTATAEERAEIEERLVRMRELSSESDQMRQELRIVRERMGDESGLRHQMKILRERFGEDGELRTQLEELRLKMAEGGELDKEMEIVRRAMADVPEFRFECDGSGEMMRERVGADGKKVMVFCRSAGMASAKMALGEARRAVERDRDLSARERAEVLRSLDEAIEELDSSD